MKGGQRVTVVIPGTAAAYDPRQPRDRGGRWTHGPGGGGSGGWTSGLGFDEMDQFLDREFHPQQLDAKRVKHPRSGFMVESGLQRRVTPVPRPDRPIPNTSLGPEGPATFDVYDFGDPAKPGYNSLKYGANGIKVGTEPIRHVYRGMSAAEWAQARKRGYIASDQRGAISSLEGTNAAADPRSALSYTPPQGESVIVKIAVKPEDKWFTISADEYLRTREPIPLDRVQHVVEIRRGGKYDNEFQVRSGKPQASALVVTLTATASDT